MVYKPKPAKKPKTTCPFTGEELDFVELSGNKGVQIRGKNWICSELFQTLEHALWWVSHRSGVVPEFPQFTKVTTSEREPPPPDPNADVVEEFHDTAAIAKNSLDEANAVPKVSVNPNATLQSRESGMGFKLVDEEPDTAPQ